MYVNVVVDDDDDDTDASVAVSGLSEGVRSLVARSYHRRHYGRFSADNCTGWFLVSLRKCCFAISPHSALSRRDA